MSHNNIDKPDQANGVDPIESANESRPKDENTKVITHTSQPKNCR